MIVVFRNFRRNRMVNLSAISVKHFLPSAKIYCFTYYKDSPEEYNSQESLLPFINNRFLHTKYVSNNNIHDHIDPTKTSGYANPDNGKYFSEGFNDIYKAFTNSTEPVLILAEDHFFTTGIVLRELQRNKWSVAYASGYTDSNANASILGIVPNKLQGVFPLPEISQYTIEDILRIYLLDKIPNKALYKIKNRKWIDYCGDGCYTNSSEEIELKLKEANII